jgi:hypothetical protein
MTAKSDTRRNVILATAALIAGLLLTTRAARAQDLEPPRPRQGYYIGLAMNGVVWSGHDSSEGWRGPWFGPTGALRAGQQLFHWLDLGLSIGVGAAFDSDYYALPGHVSIEAQLRPIDALFIRTSVGFGFADVTRRVKGIEKVIGQAGGAYSLAVGYDFFPGQGDRSGGLSITPVVGIEVGPGDPLTTLTGWIGIELSWWTGLPRDQLVLPEEEAYR